MKQLRVLVVDDDQDFAESLAMVMEIRGHHVELAFNGVEAVDKFREQDFDIAFMDVKLPGMNGVESFLEVRKFKPEARVVMVTGYSVAELLEQAVANGAWGVLHKPLDMPALVRMLEKVKPYGLLIADDDRDFVDSVKDMLIDEGWKVFVAHNGKEAVEQVLSNAIDLLILDLHMPVLSGLETYLELKRMGREVPTIIVTAYADEESDSIRELPANSIGAIVRKPFDPRELIEAVERITGIEVE